METEEPKIPPIQKKYLTIDPGLKHTCVSLVSIGIGPEGTIKALVIWTKTFDLSGKVNPDITKAQDAINSIKWEAITPGDQIDEILIEFQPPINVIRNPALTRWNSWIEGYFIGALLPLCLPINYVHPNGMKQKLCIRGGSHQVNKTLALHKAREYLSDLSIIRSDHEADCVLMGVYQYMKTCT